MFCLQNASIKFETYHSSKLSFVNSHVHSSHNQWIAIMTIPGKTLHACVLDIITVLHKMDVEHHLSLIGLMCKMAHYYTNMEGFAEIVTTIATSYISYYCY